MARRYDDPLTRLLLAAILCVAAGCAFLTPVAGCLAAAGGILSAIILSRITQDRVATQLGLASFLLKVGLSAVFFAASYHRWPILEWYQGERGFWVFAEDGQGYHGLARDIVAAWRGRGAMPQIDVENQTFIAYVAVIYRWLGVHPLHVVVLNAWWGTLMLCAAAALLHRLQASPGSLRLGIGLLGFWPSLLLWSTQPMKDPIIVALILVGLAVLVDALAPGSKPSRPAAIRRAALGAASVFCLSLLRGYSGLILALTAGLYGGVVLWRRMATLRSWPAVSHRLLIIGGMAAGLLLSRQVDVASLVTRPVRQDIVEEATPPPEDTASPPAAPTSPQASSEPPRSMSSELKRAREVVRTRLTPTALDGVRQGFVQTGGHSVVDEDVTINRSGVLLRYIPRALMIAFLAPFPVQWADVHGRTRIFRALASVEMCVIYLLLLAGLTRLTRRARRLDPSAMAILVFCGLLVVPMSLTVANVGTLFRLRLQFLLPLTVLLCAWWRRTDHMKGVS